MKYRIFLVPLVLFGFFSSFAGAVGSQKGMFFDSETESIVRIFVNCSYSILLKFPQNKEIKIGVTQMGNGFFAGEHKGEDELIVTASHILWCNSTVGDLEKNGIFHDYQKNSKENISLENIIGLKDSKISSILGYTFDGGGLQNIQVIYISPGPHKTDEPDRALLKARVDASIPHTHISLMDDKVFEEIFYKDGIKKSVYVRGFLNFLGNWFVRYKDAKIEWVGESTFQINEHLDKGLSGSPVLFNNNGTLYALGVVSSTPLEETGRFYNWSWIAITKKSFLDAKQKKK